MNCWTNVAEKFDMIRLFFSQRSQRSYGNRLIVGIARIAEAKQKNMCVSGYMLLKMRVGMSDYFFYFLKQF